MARSRFSMVAVPLRLFVASVASIVLFLIAGGSVALGGSDFATAPISGAAIVTNAQFTNIYFFPDPNQESAEQYITRTRPDVTDPNTIDLFLKILTNNPIIVDHSTVYMTTSHYFDGLMPYRTTCTFCTGTGISAPVYLGTATTLQACVDSALKSIEPGNKVNYGILRGFAQCNDVAQAYLPPATGVPTPQVNIILSPEYDVDWIGGSNCGQNTGWHAFSDDPSGGPNFTVIPLNTTCNSNLDALTQTITHEMVETVSDPAGWGYIHETTSGRFIGDFWTSEYNQGELGDICGSNGFKNIGVPPDVPTARMLGFSVSTYWSNFDDSCYPFYGIEKTDQSLVKVAGDPLIRFTGSTHDLTLTINPARQDPSSTTVAADPNSSVTSLLLFLGTGSDDLRSGSTADVTLNLTNGRSLTVQNVNQSQEWNNLENHAVFLPVPRRVGDLLSLTIHTALQGGPFGDNWNLNSVELVARLGPPLPPPTPPPPPPSIKPSTQPSTKPTPCLHQPCPEPR